MRPSSSASRSASPDFALNMCSLPASRSASPDFAPNMQIFIKNVTGDTVPLTVPTDLTIQNLVTLISLRTSLPEGDLRLVYAGKHLSHSPSQTLASLNIIRDGTIHLALPLKGGKKQRCMYKDCKETSQRIVGDCGFCNGHFCGQHRLLEDHKCTGLEDCKKESHEKNAAQLHAERTTVIKGI